MTSKYEQFGASATKTGVHSALEQAGAFQCHSLFASITNDIAKRSDYASFLHCDGAGTKSIAAYLLFKETGSYNSFAGLAQDALVMNLDDVFCIGQPDTLLLSNLIARNARLIDNTVISTLISSYYNLIKQLSDLGIHIELGGGETADCGDVVRTLLVDAVLTGSIKRNNLISTDAIKTGDTIIGLSSTGQTTYESAPNSGIGSNGLTLARHALLNNKYIDEFPEVCAFETSQKGTHSNIMYQGPFCATDFNNELNMSIGEALTSPTRTYSPVLAHIYKELGENIHGVIHCTGGGQTKVIRFGKGCRYVKDSLFPIPPIFKLIQQHGQVSWKEMYQVFNMGHRMELYTPQECVKTIVNIASNYNLEAKQIGHVEKNNSQLKESSNEVIIISNNETYSYTL